MQMTVQPLYEKNKNLRSSIVYANVYYDVLVYEKSVD